MVRATIAFVTLTGAVLAAAGEPSRRTDFGRQWVRSHPFMTMGLTQVPRRFDTHTYEGAGLNTLLAWKPRTGLFEKAVKAGIPWHYHIHHTRYGETPEQIVAHAKQFVAQYPGCTGLMFGDEPNQAQMEKFGRVCAALRAAFPDRLIYSNAYPIGATPDRYYGGRAPRGYGYPDYLDAFARLVQGDVFMFDIYPFGEGDGHSGVYFQNLEIARRTALKHGVPYWVFVQAYERPGRRRLPSESDLRMQVFSSLAYGFTGIAYFTYDVAFVRGLVELNGTPSPMYSPAAQLNREIGNLGKALRFLTSTAVAHIPGQRRDDGRTVDNPHPLGTTRWEDLRARPRDVREVCGDALGRDRGLLVGFFRDDGGAQYLMVVNLWHGADRTAAECVQNVTLSVAPHVKAVVRLSRETGVAEPLPAQAEKVTLTLPGGTGDLLRLGPGSFPGQE